MIDVAHQMHETFLLPALEGVVGRIEIRDQDTAKVTQQFWEKRDLSRWFIKVISLVQASPDPDIALLLSQSHRSFINVDYRTCKSTLLPITSTGCFGELPRREIGTDRRCSALTGTRFQS